MENSLPLERIQNESGRFTHESVIEKQNEHLNDLNLLLKAFSATLYSNQKISNIKSGYVIWRSSEIIINYY